jgi:hypothetical protein
MIGCVYKLAFQKEVLHQLLGLRKEVEENSRLLNTILGSKTTSAGTEEGWRGMVPVSSVEDLQTLSEWTTISQNYEELVRVTTECFLKHKSCIVQLCSN